MKLKLPCFFLCLALFHASSLNGGETQPEFVRAGFLRHFALLIKWPAAAFESAESPLVIGILQPDPFGPAFDSAISGESVNNRSLRLQRFGSVEDIGPCHLLYVPASRKNEYRAILERLEGKSVVVVGEDESLLKLGGMLQFVNDGKRVGFVLNAAAIDRVKVRVGADLKQAAKKIVNEK